MSAAAEWKPEGEPGAMALCTCGCRERHDASLPPIPSQDKSRPTFTVQQVTLQFGESYLRQHQVSLQQEKALFSIMTCRTSERGGYVMECQQCHHIKTGFRPCLNRHCPNCQGMLQHLWVEKRVNRMLPIGHYHVVFTLPEQLRKIMQFNEKKLYKLLFQAASSTLQELATEQLGIRLGFTIVLHTWSRELAFHPHVHCIVTSGGLDNQGHWVARPDILLPIEDLRERFQSNFLEGLTRLGLLDLLKLPEGSLGDKENLQGLCHHLGQFPWVVFIKEPFPTVDAVVKYLGNYTHRIAISDYRILALDEQNVTIATRDEDRVTLSGEEFLRRFFMHVLPKGFTKIRHYGLYAPQCVNGLLTQAREQLGLPAFENLPMENWADRVERITGKHPNTCPRCHAPNMLLREQWPNRVHLSSFGRLE
jgi:hypothetical protein